MVECSPHIRGFTGSNPNKFLKLFQDETFDSYAIGRWYPTIDPMSEEHFVYERYYLITVFYIQHTFLIFACTLIGRIIQTGKRLKIDK